MANLKNSIQREHEEIFKIGKDIEVFADQQLQILNDRQIKLKDLPSYKRIFLFILTRAIKTYAAIEILCHNGYAQDAASLVRNLLENLITVKYIICDTKTADDKTRRFVAYKWVIFKRYLPEEEYLIRKASEEEKKEFALRKESILENVNEFKVQYKVKSDRGLLTWSGKTVKDMAKLADKELLREYESTFRMCSRFAHPSVLGDKEYLVQDEGNLVFSPVPSEIGIIANYKSTLKYFLNFLYIADDLFELNEKEKIDLLNTGRKDVFDLPKYSRESSAKSEGKQKAPSIPIKECTIIFKTKSNGN